MNPIKEWRYWRSFWRAFNWTANYKIVRSRTAKMLSLNAPNPIITAQAHMIVEAHYRGRWRMVWGVFKKAFGDHYRERYWPFWEWIRTTIFRRPQDEMLALANRHFEEEDAIEEMAKQL